MSLYRRIIQKTLKENITPFTGDRSKLSWRKNILKEFGEWIPIDGAGPTNGTSTTFGYYVGGSPVINGETGQQITYTASGIGGADVLPTSVTIDQGYGDISTVDAPTYNQLALAGYTPPLPFTRRTDFQDVNPQLDASQQFAQAVGADYMMNARIVSKEEEEKYQEELKAWKQEFDRVSAHNESVYQANVNKAEEAAAKYGFASLPADGAALQNGRGIGMLSDMRDKISFQIFQQDPYADSRLSLSTNKGKWRAENAILVDTLTFEIDKSKLLQYPPRPPSPLEKRQQQVTGGEDELDSDTSISSGPEDPAFKAGGGFAKMDQGYTYDQVLAMGRKNLDSQKSVGSKISGPKIVGPEIVGDKAVGKGYSNSMDQLANIFNVGTSKNFFDYYIDSWGKNPTNKRVDMTNLVQSKDMKVLKNIVNSVAVQSSLKNSDYQTATQFIQNEILDTPGLRNSLGNNVQIDKKHYQKTGEVKLTKDYVFVGARDIEGGGNALIRFGAPAYALLKGGVVQNKPMKYSVTIKESTTYSKVKKFIKENR